MVKIYENKNKNKTQGDQLLQCFMHSRYLSGNYYHMQYLAHSFFMTDVILTHKIINNEIVLLISYIESYLNTHTENKDMKRVHNVNCSEN